MGHAQKGAPLDGCCGVYTEGMDEDAQRELAMLYIEEIFADQYAGMNRSSAGARQAVETAGDVAQRFAGDIENARQNRAGIERRNGPGTRYALDDYFFDKKKTGRIAKKSFSILDLKALQTL